MSIFQGIITALVTPFNESGDIDFHSLEKILDGQIEAGIKSIVVGGSTGEALMLDPQEFEELLSFATRKTKNKLNIIVGISSASTKMALSSAKLAEKYEAQGIMAAVPYYVKPNQDGIFAHFKMIHDETNLPLMLYSVPSRSGADFTDETIISLCEACPRIEALKDAGNDFERPLRLKDKIDIKLLGGNDSSFLAYLAQGGDGIVSVASNLIPKEFIEMQALIDANDYKGAREIHQSLNKLYQALNVDTNPITIKYALAVKGLCLEDVRMPLMKTHKYNKAIIKKAIIELGVIDAAHNSEE